MYTGKRCHRGLILVPEIGELQITSKYPSVELTIARPTNGLTVELLNDCNIHSGVNFYAYPCKLEFDHSKTKEKFSIISFTPGVYYLNFILSGDDANAYDIPDPVPVIVSSGKESVYFSKLDSPYIYDSCCRSSQIAQLKCGMNPQFGIQFTSSCGWKNLTNGISTNGIVFSGYKNLSLPVSVAGLEINSGDSYIGTPREDESTSTCNDCNKVTLSELASTEVSIGDCYKYGPKADDLREFVSKQSLAVTYISEIQSKLLPAWLTISVPNDVNATKVLAESDYRVSIVPEVDVTKLRGCESLILDKTGYFSVLQHNGPLNVSLMTSDTYHELHAFSSPLKGSFYCVAVELCSGHESSVYFGIPLSTQGSFQKINFLNEYIGKGWKLNFFSFIVQQNLKYYTIPAHKYWNGIKPDYSHPNQKRNLVISMMLDGTFAYGDTNVTLSFSGNISHNYAAHNEVSAQ